MDRDEFIQALGQVPAFNFVKAFHSNSPTNYDFEMYPDMDDKTRTQIVRVFLTDDAEHVVTYSIIGDCPNDSQTLLNLLKENIDGCYSRICILNEQLVQLYKYSLKELETVEMVKAFDEVSTFADYYENKYFGGVDNR